MSAIIWLVLLMVLASVGIILLATSNSRPSDVPVLSVSKFDIPVYNGVALPSPIVDSVSSIVDLMVCSNVPINGSICLSSDSSDSIVVYWEVLNGVGCCHSFNCDYVLFSAFCGTPYNNFKLYDIALDGVLFDWSKVTVNDNYTYHCGNGSIYNYQYFPNVSIGHHSVKVFQKDCLKVVDVESIDFTVSSVDDKYIIGVGI